MNILLSTCIVVMTYNSVMFIFPWLGLHMHQLNLGWEHLWCHNMSKIFNTKYKYYNSCWIFQAQFTLLNFRLVLVNIILHELQTKMFPKLGFYYEFPKAFENWIYKKKSFHLFTPSGELQATWANYVSHVHGSLSKWWLY